MTTINIRNCADGKVTEPGLYRMTAEQYHADPCPEPAREGHPRWTLRGNADNKGGHGADMRKHYTRVRLPTRAHVTVELPKRKAQ